MSKKEKIKLDQTYDLDVDGGEIKKTEETNLENNEKEEPTKETTETGKKSREEELIDKYYDQALEVVMKTKKTSFTFLAKQLKIKDKEARVLLDKLEKEGVVGPSINNVTPREFLGGKTKKEEVDTENEPEEKTDEEKIEALKEEAKLILEEQEKKDVPNVPEEEEIAEDDKKEENTPKRKKWYKSFFDKKEEKNEEEEIEVDDSSIKAIFEEDKVEPLSLKEIEEKIKRQEEKIKELSFFKIREKKHQTNLLEKLQEQKRELLEISEDRKNKQFLYYAFEKSNNEMLIDKKTSNLTGVLDLRTIEKDWDEISYNRLMETGENEGFFDFNIFGFVKIIKNVNEIKSEDGINAMSEEAIYKIVGPNGEIIADDVKGYSKADEIYAEKTEEQKKKIEEAFANEPKEEKGASTLEDDNGTEEENGEEDKEEAEKTTEEKVDETRALYLEQLKKNKKANPEELKRTKESYDQARKEMGEEMFEKKKSELQEAGLEGEELEEALAEYKATEILAKTIIDERKKILDARKNGAEIKPALWKRAIDAYQKIEPRWKRVAISTLIFLPFAAAGGAGASIVAGYGLAGLATFKFATSMAIGTITAQSVKGIDLAMKEKDRLFTEKHIRLNNELKNSFAKGDISLTEYESSLLKYGNERKTRARNRTLLKASVGIFLGLGAGFAAYGAIDNLFDNTTDSIASGTDGLSGGDNTIENINKENIEEAIKTPEEIIPTDSSSFENPVVQDTIKTPEKISPVDSTNIEAPATENEAIADSIKTKGVETPSENISVDETNAVEAEVNTKVEATANNGQGAISTLRELQNNLKAEYGDLNQAPENVKHIIETDPHDLVKEYGMYRPGEEAESAKVFVGDKIIFDKESGEVIFHQAKDGKDIVLQKGVAYEGDMFDANKINEVVNETKEGFEAPEQTNPTESSFEQSDSIQNSEVETESDFLKNNPQISPEETEVKTNPETINENLTEEILKNQEIKTSAYFNNEEALGGNENSSSVVEQTPIKTYEESVKQFFPDNDQTHTWDRISKFKAREVMDQITENKDKKLNPFFAYLKELHDDTRLEPRNGGIFRKPESVEDYLKRLINNKNK